MEDWKQILHWSVKHWYLYLVSIVLCLAIGYLYYHFAPSTYKVSASLMLRQATSQNAQDQLIGMMGFGGKKVAVDEVEILTSPDLYKQVVSRLDLNTLYFYREKGKWKQLYPTRPFSLIFPADCSTNVWGTLTVKEGQYKLQIKDGNSLKSTARSDRTTGLFATHLGTIVLQTTAPIADGRYRIEHRTPDWAFVYLSDQISVRRASRESSVLHLETVTPNAQMMCDVETTMLAIYNNESVDDKNILARETDLFLQARLAEVAKELDSAEVALEAYKRTHSIANLDNTAESYRIESDKLERRINQLDADLAVMDIIAQTLNRSEITFTVFPSNLGINDATLTGLVASYNEQVILREKMLQTAQPDNPAVLSITEQILRTRQGLLTAIDQTRQSTLLTRQNVQQQFDLYKARLQSVPQLQKQYVEMQRYRDSKEKQYKYLLERSEANSLLLVSEAVPVKVIQSPTINPKRQSPRFLPIIAVAVIIGFGLPLALYFLLLLPGLLRTPAVEPKTKDE